VTTYLVGGLLTPEPTTVEKKRYGIEIHGLAIAVCVHQLLQLCGPLDAEEDLVAILQNKGTKVLRTTFKLESERLLFI
jgi:hypothetical protein